MGTLTLQLDFDDGVTAADLPLTPASLKKVLAVLDREIHVAPEWSDCVAALGRNPQWVSLLVCGDVKMREFQREYRKLDRTTDVLSFPTREIPDVLELSKLPVADAVGLGDLIISLPAVARGAVRGRRSVEREFVDVFIHGCLHLVGLDHVGVSPLRAKRMKALQRQLFLKAVAAIKAS